MLSWYTWVLAAGFIASGCNRGGVLEIEGSVPVEGDTDTDVDTDSDVDDLEPAGDYSEPGDWTAGTLRSEFGARGGNNLITNVWYPSLEQGNDLRTYGWTGWYNQGEAYTDVAPDCSEPRPVMVHSHGNTSINFEMFYLQEFLASHGWVVAAPDHSGNTLYDYTADFYDLLSRRPHDLQDTFDWLVEQSTDPNSSLYGCVDEDAGYVSSGYSFGGYTAYVNGGALVNDSVGPAFDYSDPRVWGVITFAPWDAWEYLSSGSSAIQVPVLTIGGEADDTVGTQFKDFYSHLTVTPRAMASFHEAGHFSFTPIYCSVWGNGCGPYYVDQDAFVSFVKTSVLSFSEHLRGRSGALEQLPPEDGNFIWSYTE
jgi:predicted dienelactone hydrolase